MSHDKTITTVKDFEGIIRNKKLYKEFVMAAPPTTAARKY